MNTQKNNPKTLQEQIRQLKKKVVFLIILTITLAIAIASVSFYLILQKSPPEETAPYRLNQQAPQAKEIKQLLSSLEYSGLKNLLRPDVKISIDFLAQNWTLHNIHRFDNNGNIVLTDNRYGLCGDLAAYAHSKIQPLLGSKYVIEFIHVAESGFFLDPRASHIALIIREPSIFGDKEYFLDPSFHKYGPIDVFDDYQFFERLKNLPFITEKRKDEVFPAGISTPLLITKDALIGLMIDYQNGKLDKDNFILSFTATRRYKFSGRYILAFRRKNGNDEILENENLGHALLGQAMYKQIKEKLQAIYSQLK